MQSHPPRSGVIRGALSEQKIIRTLKKFTAQNTRVATTPKTTCCPTRAANKHQQPTHVQETKTLINRIDRLIAVLEGRYRPANSETWMKLAELKNQPEFRHRRGNAWIYQLAVQYPDIKRKECLPHQKRGATLWCVERILKALAQSTKKQLHTNAN